MKLFQIVEGIHDQYEDENELKVLPQHTGSVILAHGSFGKVLFDTGSRGAWPKVKKVLAEKGVMPEDIDFVFLTHLHLDHSFNVARFPNARVFCWAHEWKSSGTYELVFDIDKQAIPEILTGITAIRTPGHDECMNSYFIEGAVSLNFLNGEEVYLANKKLCISGDAINPAVIDSKGSRLPYFYDEKLYKKSVQKILGCNPDFIIPGHGPLISKPVEGWSEIL